MQQTNELTENEKNTTPELEKISTAAPEDFLQSPGELEARRKLAKKILNKRHTALRVPNPGFTFNPLKSIERNSLCPCQSGKKFKRCHLPLLPDVVTEKEAETYRKVMATHKHIQFVDPTRKVAAATDESTDEPGDTE